MMLPWGRGTAGPRAWRGTRKPRLLFLLLLLLLSLFLVQAADLAGSREPQFVWKAGPWGRCTGGCGGGGTQTRTVRCFHVDGRTSPQAHCLDEDKPEEERGCFRACTWHREFFEWEVAEWDACQLVPRVPTTDPGHRAIGTQEQTCTTAQPGLQRRPIRCVQKQNRTQVLVDICEQLAPRPPGEQACLMPCPRGCVVSEFSSWSACGPRCGASVQHRIRTLLVPPLFGGEACPSLSDVRGCESPAACTLGEPDVTTSLSAGPWSPCRPPPRRELASSRRTLLDFSSNRNERSPIRRQSYRAAQRLPGPRPPEIGYQTRQVRCVRSDGQSAPLSLCLPGSSLSTMRSCALPEDCETTDWSPWSLCSKTCQSEDHSPGLRSRRRRVRRVAVEAGRDCPALLETEACNLGGDTLQPCPRFSWKTSEWKGCQPGLLLESQNSRQRAGAVALCGGGLQIREVFCVQEGPETSALVFGGEGSRPVERKLCPGPAPSAIQLCYVPCSVDCMLSTWSTWGSCLPETCRDPQGKKGFRMRQRHVVIEVVGPTGRCPHLVEASLCEEPACHRWKVEAAHCVPEHGTCGPGQRKQRAECRDAQGEVVAPQLCPSPPPDEWTACTVPCDSDCVLSEWTQWTPCPQACVGKSGEGMQSRTRAVLAPPGDGGKPCPSGHALHQLRPCSDHPCTRFYWEASSWGPCLDAVGTTSLNSTIGWNGEATCGVGVQTRKVSCVNSHIGPVASKRCPDALRPETLQPCLLPCRRDCVVTPFSEWTPCPSSCRPGNGPRARQSRYRVIVEEAAPGGRDCPDTLFEERECDAAQPCPNFRWKTHPWSPCILVPEVVRQAALGSGEACGQGLQSRAVTCEAEAAQPVEMEECLRGPDPMPPLLQPCLLPCRDDCTFTPWSRFTPCSANCTSTRTRRRTLTGRSRKRERCLDGETYPLQETEPCPCHAFRAQPYGDWSDCILSDSVHEQQPRLGPVGGRAHGCGEGLRLRALACLDALGRLVALEHCGGSGYVEEACTIPCPFDCRLSDWSIWGPCSARCGVGVRTRSRWLKEKPHNGGRPCPTLDLRNQVHETMPCFDECHRYSWAAGPWSPCEIPGDPTALLCGEGLQTRKVRCVRTVGESGGEMVDRTLCDQTEIPAGAQRCIRFCPSQCVLSHWEPWSPCPQPCDPRTTQRRTRHVLRPALSGGTCAGDVQLRPCVLNENCFQHQYNLTEWSTCQLSGNTACGHGVQTRLLSCVRSDGAIVATGFCEELGLTKPSPLSSRCLVECVVDCRLSPWSSWSQCSQSCGLTGHMSRTRQVVLQPQGEGRPCPPRLSQIKPCPVKPCYAWLVGGWSPCTVEGGDCGEGLQSRTLTCVVHNASLTPSAPPVEEVLCARIPLPESPLQRLCSVPCPGDCHLAEWTSWSACELTCLDGRSFGATGHQSRSRASITQALNNRVSCPEQVLETRPCTGGKCFHYEWKSSLWRNNERAVWCQRSDGMNVTGGCSPQSRPVAVRHCHPDCRKPFSYCTQNGVCGCKPGYTEILRSNGFLDYCLKVSSSGDRKADVKTSTAKNKPVNSKIRDIFRTWSLHPVDADGRVKLWVYGISAGGILLVLLLTFLSYLVCKKPSQHQSPAPQQKPLTLAYDGDVDM
uniref:Complement component C9 n=1 Tax=Ornithorhynchus anatinus TaxID=9258 RepID=A0A6I8P9R6_ORNAN